MGLYPWVFEFVAKREPKNAESDHYRGGNCRGSCIIARSIAGDLAANVGQRLIAILLLERANVLHRIFFCVEKNKMLLCNVTGKDTGPRGDRASWATTDRTACTKADIPK